MESGSGSCLSQSRRPLRGSKICNNAWIYPRELSSFQLIPGCHNGFEYRCRKRLFRPGAWTRVRYGCNSIFQRDSFHQYAYLVQPDCHPDNADKHSKPGSNSRSAYEHIAACHAAEHSQSGSANQHFGASHVHLLSRLLLCPGPAFAYNHGSICANLAGDTLR